MENEVMEYEEAMEPETYDVETESDNSGLGTGAAMLIGAGLTLAVGAAVKLGKKVYAKIKAKKEQDKEEDDHDFVVATDEDFNDATK